MPSACARSKPRFELAALTPGIPGQVAIPGAVEHVEPLAAKPVQRQPLGNPGREAEHAGDVRVRRDPDRDGAAHREPDEERRAGNEVERGTPVGHARVERVPRLERDSAPRRRRAPGTRNQLGREQLAGGAPRPRHRASRAPVDEDHGERRSLVREPRIGAAGELNDSGHCAVRFTAGVHDLVAAATARARSR